MINVGWITEEQLTKGNGKERKRKKQKKESKENK
jgi:hypothetical protein